MLSLANNGVTGMHTVHHYTTVSTTTVIKIAGPMNSHALVVFKLGVRKKKQYEHTNEV